MEKKPFLPSGRQVRAIRAWLDMSQPEFAAACSISASALYDFEKGRRATSPGVLEAIAAYVATTPIRSAAGNAIILGV